MIPHFGKKIFGTQENIYSRRYPTNQLFNSENQKKEQKKDIVDRQSKR